MVYQWKDGARISADPEKVGKEIASLGREVTPRDVVDTARDKSTELHACFEWDDSVAAEEYRLTQAREVMRALVFVEDPVEEDAEPVRYRCYENVDVGTAETGSRRAYVPIKRIMKDDGLRMQVFARLESMMHEAQTIAESYEHLASQLTIVKTKAREARAVLVK